MNTNMTNIIYPELSYKVMGAIFKVHNELGPAYQEKYYQRALEKEFIQEKIQFDKEKLVNLCYQGDTIGKYYIDFVIEEKIALETKTIDFFRKKDIRQVLAYLSATNLKLAILVNFNCPKIQYKRIVNSRVPI